MKQFIYLLLFACAASIGTPANAQWTTMEVKDLWGDVIQLSAISESVTLDYPLLEVPLESEHKVSLRWTCDNSFLIFYFGGFDMDKGRKITENTVWYAFDVPARIDGVKLTITAGIFGVGNLHLSLLERQSLLHAYATDKVNARVRRDLDRAGLSLHQIIDKNVIENADVVEFLLPISMFPRATFNMEGAKEAITAARASCK